MNKLIKMPPSWEMVQHNYVLRGQDFYISFNPDTTTTHQLTELGNVLGAELVDGTETALVKKGQDGKYIYCILTGDFRDDYEKLVSKGYDACYKFFKTQQHDHGNNWSTKEEDRP